MTTSIPEAANSGRNWDYRYCWLRDAFFVVRALNSLSEVGTMEDYLHWVYNVVRSARDGHVQPLYGVGLERELHETVVTSLSGYRGMGPVRVGNQAYEHVEHDGTAASCSARRRAFSTTACSGAATPPTSRRCKRWASRPGACTTRPTPASAHARARVHTSSSLMCWAACDRLARIARRSAGPGRARAALARAGRRHPRADPRARLERRAKGLRRKLRRARARCQRAADGRGGLPAAERPALRQHGGGDGPRALRRALHAPLRSCGRFRQTRDTFNVCRSGVSMRWRASGGARKRARPSPRCSRGEMRWDC